MSSALLVTNQNMGNLILCLYRIIDMKDSTTWITKNMINTLFLKAIY